VTVLEDELDDDFSRSCYHGKPRTLFEEDMVEDYELLHGRTAILNHDSEETKDGLRFTMDVTYYEDLGRRTDPSTAYDVVRKETGIDVEDVME